MQSLFSNALKDLAPAHFSAGRPSMEDIRKKERRN